MLLFSIVLYCVMVTASESSVGPTISPTFTPTTTLHPTTAQTKAPIPSPVPFRPCYSNLTEIEDLVKMKSPFIVETYILCPNTTYKMGSLDVFANEMIDGWKPIFTRSNSIFQCGEDGKSSSNCIITGGVFQLMHEVQTFNNELKENVVIKGITFEDATRGAALLAAPGDITFIDCIFKNHQNNGALQLVYCDSCSSTRQLKTVKSTSGTGTHHSYVSKYYIDLLGNPKALASLQREASRSRNRCLQDNKEIKTQLVTLDGCLFDNNFRGSESGYTFNGVIYLATASNDINVKNTIFRNNNFANRADGVPGNGYALASVQGAKVAISDTCFTNNLFSGKGVVVFEGPATDFTANNIFGTLDEKLSCSFASVSGESCVDYDSAICTAVGAFSVDSAATADERTVTTGETDMTWGTSSSLSIKIDVFWFSSFLLLLAAVTGI